MNRDFLKATISGITDEQISAILDEIGKDKEASKTALADATKKLTDANTQIESLNNQVKQRDKDLKALQNQVSGQDDLSQQLSDMQEKYNKDTKALQDQLIQRRRDFAADKLFGKFKFSSDWARKAAMSEFREQNFKLNENDEFEGGEAWIAKLQENVPTAFEQETADPELQKNTPTDGQKPFFAHSVNKDPKKVGLGEMMRQKNQNPNMPINFESGGN